METIYIGITPGAEIVDSAGAAVGKVHEVICDAADQLQLVTVQRGLIFKRDVGIPAAAIARVAGGTIHLSVSKADLAEMLKPTPPEPPRAGDLVPQVQAGVFDPDLNAGEARPALLHDSDTAGWTHDRGLGSAGVPGEGAGPAPFVIGGEGALLPGQAEDPTSRNRT